MGLGILEDRHMAMPPGTSRMSNSKDDVFGDLDLDKVTLKKRGDVILIPQPEDDPNDPLNWSGWWKNAILVILGITVAVTISLGHMITPGLNLIADKYHVSLDGVNTWMIGSMAFWTGFTTFFTSSGATIWGKRPFFVISAVVLLGTCVWGYAATSFKSLAVMRAIQGIAGAPLETLVTAAVADLFFVHQRGTRVAIWGTMLGGGIGLGQVIAGFIIQNLGVQATFGVCALWYAVLIPLVYFVVLETTYPRKRSTWNPNLGKDTDAIANKVDSSFVNEKTGQVVISAKDTDVLAEKADAAFAKEKSEQVFIETIEINDEPKEIPTKEPYTQRLRLYRGRLSKASFWKGVVKPIPMIVFPSILYSTIVHGTFFVWVMVEGLVSLQILRAPPYKLKPSQLGLTKIPHTLSSFIFHPLSGFAADWVAKFMARRNNGIFEPEFRLLLMLIAVPISTVAFIGFGIAVERKASLAWVIFWGTLQSVAQPFGTQAALTYVMDCHPQELNQAFVTINFSKSVIVFLASSKVAGWYQHAGPRVVFNTCAGISLAVSSLTIPAYIYGKRFRSMVARSKLAQQLDMQ